MTDAEIPCAFICAPRRPWRPSPLACWVCATMLGAALAFAVPVARDIYSKAQIREMARLDRDVAARAYLLEWGADDTPAARADIIAKVGLAVQAYPNTGCADMVGPQSQKEIRADGHESGPFIALATAVCWAQRLKVDTPIHYPWGSI